MWHRNGTETPESFGYVHGFPITETIDFVLLLGSLSRSGRGGRRFKSYHSDQQIQALTPPSPTLLAQKRHRYVPREELWT